jgi:hypothetical protein
MSHKDKGRLPPFVPLLKETLASPAWRAMSHGARSLYTCLKARYSTTLHNNGRLFVSQRVAAREIGSGFKQIARWFRELQYFGFIVQTKGGSLGVNGKGTAPHWRLTECGYMRDSPTRDFMSWNGEPFMDTPRPRRKKQNPVAENRNTPLRKTATPTLRKSATPQGTSVAENRNMVGPDPLRKNTTYLTNHSQSPIGVRATVLASSGAAPAAPCLAHAPDTMSPNGEDDLDIPDFLLVQNRNPLASEQQKKADATARGPDCEIKKRGEGRQAQGPQVRRGAGKTPLHRASAKKEAPT